MVITEIGASQVTFLLLLALPAVVVGLGDRPAPRRAQNKVLSRVYLIFD